MLQSVVDQLLEATTGEESEEDFTASLLEALEEAGLDTSAPILDWRV